MSTHYGRIDGQTKAGRTYRYLSARRGRWVSAWTLAAHVRTLCLHSYVHEARCQLVGETIEHRTVRRGGVRVEEYRVVEARA